MDGVAMAKCFLHGFGACGGKITREHYVSQTVLEAIGSGNSIHIGGLPWLPPGELRTVGIGSLTTRALCERHNSGLSDLDATAGKLIRMMDAADKDPKSLPPVSMLIGKCVERWFLKVLCGLVSAAGFNNAVIPDQWKRLLVGGSWPAKWGLYLPTPAGIHVLAKEFAVTTLVDPETNNIKAAQFRLAGVHFALVLGQPDNQHVWGKYRPRGIVFEYQTGASRKVELVWRRKTDEAVIYTKVGEGGSEVPQWEGWQTPKRWHF